MFDFKFNLGLRRDRKMGTRIRAQRIDLVTEQVKKVLTNSDQKLILMVRG
ncbi:hypothetical protein HYS96_04575 [Candidatus Daviesbacteria bacterium]|nr:hypothetical protein [Candidatus Daviesbacteria bacterium]